MHATFVEIGRKVSNKSFEFPKLFDHLDSNISNRTRCITTHVILISENIMAGGGV
jgi:hypothetical protein